MKKTIIYLSLALVAFSNVAIANVSETSNTFRSVKTEMKSATPLATAIAKGDVETVKKFIEYGIDVNEKSNGMTPLMIAARYNQVEIIKLLLEKGANLKLTDEKGLSALRYAELSNAPQAVEALKQAKA
ncbi:ankyrin repeat domain-containing protein [Flavobacterium subsaxonicum]|uniref:Ankyrin n=1 Tax=Flavobacterium subsaxonicum WB 4.1-42 = DSM 21790 TaxID=1121898 RepID=A0A0A2MH41_9FLAO|nr:ankyrin repeat domain-containing protein [Flavobacterium subsaxonicum]KGO91987.1 ankyrin [Flavobacterium subsaxonicum WB 4.1-42 = DSM 21790]